MTAQATQKVFGAGRFFGIPTITSPTPSRFGLTQDLTLDFKRDVKKLFGENQMAADVASGTLSVTGKASLGTIAARQFNDLLIGGTLTTGSIQWIDGETLAVPASSASGIASTVANGATFLTDLGIKDFATGYPFVRVTTGIALSSQQYTASTAGVYTFSSLSLSASMRVSYTYLATTFGQEVTMTNQPMGKIGNFQAVMALLWGSEKATIQLNNCMASDYSLGTKLDDYAKPSFGFDAGTDTTDTLGTISYAELS